MHGAGGLWKFTARDKSMSRKKKKCYCGIGGQAVLEGVMMKNEDRYAVAVRKADGSIEIKKEDYKGIWGGKKVTKIPFLRGIFNFLDSLILGMSTLTWSAQFFEEEDPKEENKRTAKQKKQEKTPGSSADKLATGATVAFSIVLAVAIFIALPYFLSFAAGAMMYVVVEELIPEMSAGEHSHVGVISFAIGFMIMMSLDVALG